MKVSAYEIGAEARKHSLGNGAALKWALSTDGFMLTKRSEWERGWESMFKIWWYISCKWLKHNVWKFQEDPDKSYLLVLGWDHRKFLSREKWLCARPEDDDFWRFFWREEMSHSLGLRPLWSHSDIFHSSGWFVAKGPAYSRTWWPSKLFLIFLMSALRTCHGSGFHILTCWLAFPLTVVP